MLVLTTMVGNNKIRELTADPSLVYVEQREEYARTGKIPAVNY